MLKGGTLPEDTRGFMIKVEHFLCEKMCNRKKEKSETFEMDSHEQQLFPKTTSILVYKIKGGTKNVYFY